MISFSEKFALAGAGASLGTLDQLGTPALLLDRYGTVKLLNPAAEALLGADLKLVHRQLKAAHQPSDQNLQAFIASLRQPEAFRTSKIASPLRIVRKDKRPLLIEAMPIAGRIADVFQSLSAILLITDLEARPIPAEHVVRTVFDLTGAEARLALRLVAGQTLEAAAATLGITKNTARVQLKTIFTKTDTNRQAELVALLGRLSR